MSESGRRALHTESERRWVRVASSESLPVREGRSVVIGDREIALFNLGDRILAVENRCPHRGGPLCDGIVTGSAVVCPLHAWKVNLESGSVERPGSADACTRTYRTRTDQGVVSIEIPAATESSGEGQAA